MFYFIFFSFYLALPAIVFGQVTYSPLIDGGGLDTTNIGSYINSLYLISISIAALLATIKLIIAGAKYMLSDVVTTQGEAKKEIQSSLLGLLLVISAVLILTIINPDLISNQLTIQRVAPATVPSGGGSASSNSGTNTSNLGNTIVTTQTNGSGNRVATYDFSQYPNTRQRQVSVAARERECSSEYGIYNLSADRNSATCTFPRSFTIFNYSQTGGGRGNPNARREQLAAFRENCAGQIVDEIGMVYNGDRNVCVIR